MRLTAEQILKMAEAVNANGTDTTSYYVTEDTNGKIRFGAIVVVEKEQPIPLSKIKVEA